MQAYGKPTAADLPDHIRESMARGLVLAVDAFYANPGNVRKFEEWKARRDAERKEN